MIPHTTYIGSVGFLLDSYREGSVSRGSGNDIVEEIKNRANIVDVIGRVVNLKKAGSNYKGLCPFHNEKTPSFIVSEEKQIFTCFGCGESGDVISFVEKYNNLDFKGACELLAGEYGIEMNASFGGNPRKKELHEVNRLAARFFYRALREKANPAYTYMKGRGISEETMNSFGIGYADGQWDSLIRALEAQGIKRDTLIEVGLATSSGGRVYDKFRDRVIFPIINTGGKVIGFGGRILGDGTPKYLNSPESIVFQKKNNLYGLNLTGREVKKADRIILVEGYMDVISLYQAGVRNVAASLGTALTENQATLIKRYTKNVVLSYDADEAGQNAAMRGTDILYQADCQARVLRVTDGKDPDEFIQSQGREAFDQLVENAQAYGDFKIRRFREKYDLADEQQRLAFLREMITELRKMKPMEADLYIQKVAEETGISERAIRMEYSAADPVGADRPAPMRREEVSGPRGIPAEDLILLKLMLLDERCVALPEDIARSMERNDDIAPLWQMIRDYTGHRPVTAQSLGEDVDLQPLLERIDREMIPAGKEEQTYRDCIAFARKRELTRRDREITDRLTLADGQIPDEEMNALMREQAEIQRKLKGQGESK